MEKTIYKTKNKVRLSKADIAFNVIIYTFAILMIIITLYPMWFVIIASFSDPVAIGTGKVILLPKSLTLEGYKKLFEYKQLWVGYKNTILYVIVGTGVSLVTNIATAFALSRKELFGRRTITTLFLIPMFFTGGIVPTYLTILKLGMIDTFWVMVIPFAVSTYYIIVGRTFFTTSLSEELWEASQLDGCGFLGFFFRVALPLSKAVISVIALWSAVGLWNGYFNAMIYLNSESLQPLQLVLRNILITQQSIATWETGKEAADLQRIADLIKYGIIVLSSAPIMSLYPFVQKYFNQGVMLGSVKG